MVVGIRKKYYIFDKGNEILYTLRRKYKSFSYYIICFYVRRK